MGDPFKLLHSENVATWPDGSLHASDLETRRLILQLDLNSPRLKMWRSVWMRIVDLAATDLPRGTLDEIARVGNGNFLVLKLVCSHVRARLAVGEVDDFIRRLARSSSKNAFGFVYQEYWDWLIGNLGLDEGMLIADVAGLLVNAKAPICAEMICDTLRLRARG